MTRKKQTVQQLVKSFTIEQLCKSIVGYKRLSKSKKLPMKYRRRLAKGHKILWREGHRRLGRLQKLVDVMIKTQGS